MILFETNCEKGQLQGTIREIIQLKNFHTIGASYNAGIGK